MSVAAPAAMTGIPIAPAPAPGAPAPRLGPHHVLALIRYANELAPRIRGEPGDVHLLSEHTIAVRDLASRLARFLATRETRFGAPDLALLEEIGNGLRERAAVLAGSEETRPRAQRKERAAAEVLEIHAALRGVAA